MSAPFQNYDQGYYVTFPKQQAVANARLIAPTGDTLDLMIYEYSADLGLAGTTAQSAYFRTFYPRNIQQPAYTITGQCANQYERGRLAEFIRQCQISAISLEGSTHGLTQLIVPAGGTRIPGQPGFDPNTRTPSPGTAVGIKGRDSGFACDGYIGSIDRGGTFGEFAPEYSFGFLVAHMNVGIYKDDHVKIRTLQSWTDLLKGTGASYVTDPDAHGRPSTSQQQQQQAQQTAQDVAGIATSVLGGVGGTATTF